MFGKRYAIFLSRSRADSDRVTPLRGEAAHLMLPASPAPLNP
jgi:hypothetical protein